MGGEGMFRRKRKVQDLVTAKLSEQFFRLASTQLDTAEPDNYAKGYGSYLCTDGGLKGRHVRKLRKAPFNIHLAADDYSFVDVTKRATLVSDTLLMTHEMTDAINWHRVRQVDCGWDEAGLEHVEREYEMGCPDTSNLGKWLMAAEPLMKAGLSWYMPNIRCKTHRLTGSYVSEFSTEVESEGLVELVVRHRRVVDSSGARPIKNRLVRPILEIDLPFLDGVTLRDFGNITVQEFDAYASFRDFLRISLLEIDDSLDAVQSEQELAKLGTQISDQVRAAHSLMKAARRKKAVAVSGAAVGTVSAVLAAVYGPAFKDAITVMGASGGAWGILNAAAENSMEPFKEDKWYYVWALSQQIDRNAG